MSRQLSPFETEILSGLQSLRTWQHSHDRYVLIGLAISLLPLPPASLVALGMAAINLRLIAKGKLSTRERKFVIAAIGFAIVGIAVFALVALRAYDARDGILAYLRELLGYANVFGSQGPSPSQDAAASPPINTL